MIQVFRVVLSAELTGFLLPVYITVPQLPEHEVHMGVTCHCQAKVMIKSLIFYQLFVFAVGSNAEKASGVGF